MFVMQEGRSVESGWCVHDVDKNFALTVTFTFTKVFIIALVVKVYQF